MPVALVDKRLAGALVAAHFRALRPLPSVSSLWLWGVLNCQSGLAYRTAIAAGTTIPSSTRSALSELEVPLAPPATQSALESILSKLERGTHIEEEEAPATWWRVGDLRNRRDWHLETVVGNPELIEGTDLGDLCAKIARGRNVGKLAVDQPAEHLIPVTDIRVLGGLEFNRWVPDDPGRLTIAEPGDVLVAAVGDRPHAAVATKRTAVGDRVFLLRLRGPDQAAALAQFLNSTEGYRRRSLFLTRGGAPSLAKRDLEKLPIPVLPLSQNRAEHSLAAVTPLAEQLERVLWQR